MEPSGQLPAIVLEVYDSLDSSNCQALIEQVKEACQAGSQQIIVDLHHTHTLSTYGLRALHSVVSLAHAKPLPALEAWPTDALFFKQSLPSLPNEAPYLLIRNPQPHIAQALYSLGFDNFAEIQVSV